jgi:hypothetical protein
MRRQISGILVIFTATILFLGTPLVARGAEFNAIVRNFEQRSGCERTHIPFFWVARAVVAVGHPAGASEFKLAIFEHPTLPAERFSQIVDDTLSGVWKPMVRVRSQKGEVTSIYLQENGHNVRLLIASKDFEDAMLMQVRINVGQLLRFVDDHQHSSVSVR